MNSVGFESIEEFRQVEDEEVVEILGGAVTV